MQVIDYTNFCHAVGFICQSHKASVTSWWRTPKRNASLPGAADDSKHMLGLAVDLVLDDMSDENKLELITVASSLGLRAIDEGHHIHLQVSV